MLADVAAARVVKATAATIRLVGVDQYGDAGDPGTVTASVVDSTGAEVLPPGTATTVPADVAFARDLTLSRSQTAAVDRLTVTWTNTDDGVVLDTTFVDVVGGALCSIAEVRDRSALGDESKHPTAALRQDRDEATYQIESACRRAFVPRFFTEQVRGDGRRRLFLERPDLREVVWANYWTGSAWAAVPGVDVSAIRPSAEGIARLEEGQACWPAAPIEIGYRAGFATPPADLRRAVAGAIRYRRSGERSAIDERAISVQGSEFGNVVLATPGLGEWITAVPGIDEVFKRYKWRRVLVG